MKIIASSKALDKLIERAVNIGADSVSVSNGTFRFLNEKRKVEIEVHFDEKFSADFPFKIRKWIDIATFLESIPEQPISVEFNGGSIGVYCVKYFDV
jgi:hypothetical protein